MQRIDLQNFQYPSGDNASFDAGKGSKPERNFSDTFPRRAYSLPIEGNREENIQGLLSLRSLVDIDQIRQLQNTEEVVISNNEADKKENSFQKNIFLKNKPPNKYIDKSNNRSGILDKIFGGRYACIKALIVFINAIVLGAVVSAGELSMAIGLPLASVPLILWVCYLFKWTRDCANFIREEFSIEGLLNKFYPTDSKIDKELWCDSIKKGGIPSDFLNILIDLYIYGDQINHANPSNSLQYDIGILLKSMQESRQETNRIVKELEEGLKDADEARKLEIESNIKTCNDKDLMNRISHYLAGGADTCTDRVRLTLLDALKVFADWHAERWLAQSPEERDDGWNQDSFLEMAKRNANLAMAKELLHGKISFVKDQIDKNNNLTQAQKRAQKEKIEEIEIALGYYKLFSDNKLNLPFDVHAMQFTGLANDYITDDDKIKALNLVKNVASNKEEYAKNLLKWEPLDLYLKEKYKEDFKILSDNMEDISLNDSQFSNKCNEIGKERNSFFVNKVISLLSENA